MPRKIVDGYKELSKADIGMLRELKIVGERIAKEYVGIVLRLAGMPIIDGSNLTLAV
jgi:hypothetical protein